MLFGRNRAGRGVLGAGLRIAIACLSGCLAACATLAPDQLPPTRAIEGTGDLLRALEAAGAAPSLTQGELLAELGGSGSVLRVGAAEIQAYEYPTVRERESLTGRLSQDGRQLDGRPLPWQGQPYVWATGRLLVAYVGTDGGLILLLSGLLGDPITIPEAGALEPYPPAVPAAMQALAEELGRSPEAITVVAYEQAEWPDACLGLPQPGEQCAQVVTPGWKVVLRMDGVDYELHTDEFGTQVRRR